MMTAVSLDLWCQPRSTCALAQREPADGCADVISKILANFQTRQLLSSWADSEIPWTDFESYFAHDKPR